MKKVFLCHASEDKEYVRIVAKKLTRAKVIFDEMIFNVAEDFRDEIIRALDDTMIFVFIVSRKSIEKIWCKFEIDNAIGSPYSSDWKEDSRYACSLAFSTTYSIDNYGGISVKKESDSTKQEFTTATGGLLDKTSVALAQVVPSLFPDGHGQNFNHQVGGRGAYAAANILNSISVGWGSVGFSFNFNNISKETKFMSTAINIKKINE